jgi:hypothetical protein
MSEEFLASETERTFYDYSFAWEGEAEHIVTNSQYRLIELPVPWFSLDGVVERMAFDAKDVDAQLDALFAMVGDRRFWWIVGPSSQPADLTERLVARGLQWTITWDCLALEDLSVEIPRNPDVLVEPLSWENVEAYAALCEAHEPGPGIREGRLAAAHRYLAMPRHDAHIYLASIDGRPASCVVLGIEPNGVAYLRNAFTLEQFRGRGVYLSCVAHRLAVARAAGCTYAVVQAQTKTSSPILQKRGFRRVSWLRALEPEKHR